MIDPSAAQGRRIPFGQPMLGQAERDAVTAVLNGSTLTHGPRVREFEEAFARFTGAPHAVATSTCAAALHLAALALDIGPGDEVLVSAQTHVATAHAIELCGARPVFVDSEPRTGNIDPRRLAESVTPRTKAIALVHYIGVPADMKAVREIADRNQLRVIEDCALAPGATVEGVHVGLIGDAGCFSFYPAKHMTTGEGGMLITRDANVARRAAQLRAFGIDRNIVADRDLPGRYDVQALGLNYRMSEMAAALGIEQIKRLPEFLRSRRANFRRLAVGIRNIDGLRVIAADQDVAHCAAYCLVALLDEDCAPRRDDVLRALQRRGVGASVYYPAPVPRMSYYREKYGYDAGRFRHAARISDASIALPVGPHLDDADIDFMIDALRASLAEATADV
ncbi:MAG: DegT/DnrJ/EryC1/StrS family aminotransferase [Planctomycetota bacterium]|nr:MAG: DegT/DnrJ/EryC1/StrS family aminotransferase [Planctomycetota bacterium]